MVYTGNTSTVDVYTGSNIILGHEDGVFGKVADREHSSRDVGWEHVIRTIHTHTLRHNENTCRYITIHIFAVIAVTCVYMVPT
jgi:hypothetical protein